MDFQIIDLDNISEDELMSVIDGNISHARLLSSEVERLKKAMVHSKVEEDAMTDKAVYQDETITEDNHEEDNHDFDDFEDEVDYYYSLFSSYDSSLLEGDISRILPSRHNYNYFRILYRMKALILKEIKEIKDFIGVENLSKDEVLEFRDELDILLSRIKIIDSFLNPVLDEDEEVIENKLVFMPTPSGNIHVFDELEGIDSCFYERFLELFLSIKNGTFKGVKRFNNHNILNGLCEVRGNQVRVVYARISNDTYAIITTFVKKSDNDQSYKNYLVKHCRDYKNMEDVIRSQLDNPEFISLNQQYEDELFRILGVCKSPVKELGDK